MAGWNKRAQSTGVVAWTMSERSRGHGFSPARLYRHKAGDLFWVALDRSFVVWGETCKFATLVDEFRGRAIFCRRVTYHGGARCDVETREEFAT